MVDLIVPARILGLQIFGNQQRHSVVTYSPSLFEKEAGAIRRISVRIDLHISRQMAEGVFRSFDLARGRPATIRYMLRLSYIEI
jgi:hypothetical protein